MQLCIGHNGLNATFVDTLLIHADVNNPIVVDNQGETLGATHPGQISIQTQLGSILGVAVRYEQDLAE